MNVLKSKLTWVIVASLIAIVFAYAIGSSGAKATIDKEKLNYEETKAKVEEKEKEFDYVASKVKKDIEAEQKKLDAKKTEVTEAFALVNKKNELAAEIEKLGKDADAKKGEMGKIDGDLNAKKAELEKLANTIKEKKEEPISLSAGEYIVGKDIKAGRYKATPVGRGSNFFVYNSSGRASVNTILGDSSIGVGEYVFFCADGNVIKTHAAVKLTAVE